MKSLLEAKKVVKMKLTNNNEDIYKHLALLCKYVVDNNTSTAVSQKDALVHKRKVEYLRLSKASRVLNIPDFL